jgi:hypothetical protein
MEGCLSADEQARQAARDAQRRARDFWTTARRPVAVTEDFDTPRRSRQELQNAARRTRRQVETAEEADRRREQRRRVSAARRRQQLNPRARAARALMDLDDCRFAPTPETLTADGCVSPHSVGSMGPGEGDDSGHACPHCGAHLFADEKYNMCCEKGKVKVEPFRHPTPRLRELLEGNDADSKALKSHIRQLNSALSFASLTVKHSRPPWAQGYNPNIVISGHPYYNMGPVQASPGSAPRNAQVCPNMIKFITNEFVDRLRYITRSVLNEL